MYFENTKGIMKPGSWNNRYWIFKTYIESYFNEVELSNINSRYLQKFYNDTANKKKMKSDDSLSAKSVREIVNMAKSICYYAMDEGLMNEFKFRLKRPYNLDDKENISHEYMPKEDYNKLIHACCNCEFGKNFIKAKIMSLISLTCGMRIGEVCGLQWKDIDFEKNLIYISKTVQRIYDCKTKKTAIVIGSTKSKTSNRKVALLDITKKVLFEYKLYLINHNKFHDTYFVLGNERPIEPRTLRAQYKRLLNDLEIKYIHPHALRHTFCTYALENGCDVKTVSQILGHADTSITLDIYTHITEDQIKKTINTLNNIVNSYVIVKEEERNGTNKHV